MRLFSNPQARALLLAAGNGADLPVTLGAPPDADCWRELLFEDALRRARLIAEDGVPAAAGELAGELGYEPDARAQASEIAGRLAGRRDRARIDADHIELIRELNWLDEELFVRCGRTED